ncbi:Ankyrin repeat domain-containing protein 17 [Symbiodinium microadriaticum]|uniref:Ankyrin repeat domain-containing protein 17 n=1 Tax=Symbiodinium microadriaticum TaxID=2951 RepID=A0A1Q9F5Y8_SYMMI|nr:Ankyrin repeat domain-containing protein 17 [Symbiodinium microadriaticum]
MLRVWSVSGVELTSVSKEECRLVRDVKEHLRTRRGFPVCLQQLLCEGRCLGDDVEPPSDLQVVRLTELHGNQEGIAGQEFVEAARSGNIEAVRFLLEAGVKKDWGDEGGFTALHRAAEKHAEICSLLLEAGAGTEVFNENDETPLILAARGGQTEAVCSLLDAGANIDAQDCLCRTAVMEAASGGHSEIVRLLLDAGADANVGDDRLDTALIKAACGGHAEIVQTLLDSGAKKDAKNGVKATSLICAASYGHAEVVRLLVGAGADIDVRDRDGRTALAHVGHGDLRRHSLAHFALVVAMLGSTFEAFGGSMLEQDEMVLRRLLGSAAASSVWQLGASGIGV